MPAVTSKNLQIRLLVLVLLAFIPALGFYWYTNRELRELQLQAKEGELLQRAQVLGREYRDLTEDADAFLGTLSEVPAVRDAQFPRCTRLLQRVRSHTPQYTTISVIGVDGYMTCGALTPDEDLFLGDRAYFVRSNSIRGFAVGEFALGRITGQAVVGMAFPVVEEDEVRRTVAISLDLGVLLDAMGTDPLPEDYTVTILDQNRQVVARESNLGDFTLADSVGAMAGEGFPAMPEGRQARIVEGTDLDGVERVFAVTPLAGITGDPQGYAAVGRVRATLLEEVEELARVKLQYLGIGAVVMLVLAWILGHLWLVRGSVPPTES